ncbi:hypothetical protein G7Y89_g13477 [Cudoniella acicularis]|uniref:Uncharacterized protein n=1 Tax=Cudoniella acicularis TaxID=354080 RepID=A0A8H4R8G5_9HELO|nr:hypothetical protein G7Y89_g13477 [Cudoniella acicularis]
MTSSTLGGGLFGNLGLSQPATTTAPGLSQPATTGAAASSLFGPSASQQGGLNASTQAQSNRSNTAYFDTILDNSKKRPYVATFSDDLPQLQLGLGDLRQRIKRLGAGAATPDGKTDGRVHYLLAASGVDPGAAIRDLNVFASATGRAERPQTQELQDVDVETYHEFAKSDNFEHNLRWLGTNSTRFR